MTCDHVSHICSFIFITKINSNIFNIAFDQSYPLNLKMSHICSYSRESFFCHSLNFCTIKFFPNKKFETRDNSKCTFTLLSVGSSLHKRINQQHINDRFLTLSGFCHFLNFFYHHIIFEKTKTKLFKSNTI